MNEETDWKTVAEYREESIDRLEAEVKQLNSAKEQAENALRNMRDQRDCAMDLQAKSEKAWRNALLGDGYVHLTDPVIVGLVRSANAALKSCVCGGKGYTHNRSIPEYEKEPCDECTSIRKALADYEARKKEVSV